MRKGLCFALVWALLLSCLTGCGGPAKNPYTFDALTLYLPQSFVDLKGEGFEEYDVILSDGTVTISAIREDRAMMQDVSLDDYIRMLISIHGLDCQPLKTDDVYYFNYEAGASRLFTYVVTVRETANAFWVLQAYCPAESYGGQKEAIWQYLTEASLS